jgi:hypothetical protein
MKLQELAAPKPSKQIAKVFESYFGSRISFDRLTRNQTRMMLSKVRGVLGEHRSTTARHTSQQDPKYLQLVMMEQALSSRLREEGVIVPGGGGGATNPGQPTAGAAPGSTPPNPTTQQPGQPTSQPQDPKLAMAMQKSAAGQQLTPAEQQLVAGAAMAMAESRLRREYRILKESEIQQAQVVLAAQDLVDKMQDMVEEVSELQFKDLPALVESIKNQVGVDQAMQFNTDATGALAGLLQNLQGAKQQLEAALGVVTGTGGPDMSAIANAGAAGGDMGAAGADMGAAGADMGLAGPPPGEEEEPPAAPAGAALGRARR